MAKREKFGKFVLLDEVESSGLGSEYRAAKLSATGLEKVVSVVRLNQTLAAHPDTAKNLMDQVKFAAQLQNPNILKIYGIGKVDQAYYISYEFLEGKSLRQIFQRCRQEGFPFSVDHALLIASKICSALEYAHGRKTEAGSRYFHGQVTPANVLVSYEGEVRTRGFGYGPSHMNEVGVGAEDDSQYLAPEQVNGGTPDTKSDLFAVGAILLETLTGHPLFQGGRTDDIAGRLKEAKLQSPTTDDDSLPKPIADILQKSLALDPAKRYAEMQEMRKAIDTLLFSGDFTPTTFNLAFFMHSLFREDIERESKMLKEEKDASYAEFIAEEPKPAPAPVAAPAAVVAPAAAAKAAAPLAAAAAASHGREEPATVVQTTPTVRDTHHAPPPESPKVTHHEPTSSFTFHKEEEKSSKAPIFIGLAVLGLIGAIAFFMTRKGSEPAPVATTATTLSPQASAAEEKVRQLQQQLDGMKRAQEAEATKAADDAKKKLEAQAAKTGQAVDPAALAKAQEDARKKSQVEQEKKLQEEKARLEKQKADEEARLAEERRKADEEATRAAAATTLPPTTVAVTQAPAPAAVKPGQLVNVSDVGVIEPIVEQNPPLQYPQIALRQNVEGTVELRILIDEKGKVADAQVVTGAGGKAGLNEAAVENVKRRRYRPASKDGVPVKVWIPVKVKFVLPK